MNGSPAGTGGTVRVLHAEGDDSFRELVTEVLERTHDIAVTPVAAPSAAREKLAAEEFDCVVTDDDNGFSTVIEATVDGPPCILLTGKERERVDPAATPGIDDYLQKRGGRFDSLADRIRTHAARHRDRERYRALFEEGAPPMLVHDADSGTVVAVNPAYAELMGYESEEMAPLELRTVVPDEGPYTTERALEYLDAAAAGEPQTFEWMNVTAEGDWVPVEVELKRMDVAGDARVLATVRDISDRKRREAELRRHKRSLERLHTAAQELLSAEDHGEVYAATLEAAESVLKPAFCTVVRREGDTLRPVVCGGTADPELPDPFPVEGASEGDAVTTCETQFGDDCDGPTLCVPLGSHGVLCIHGFGPDTDDARELAEVLASHATVALDRADRESELEANSERVASLSAAFPDYAFFFDRDGRYEDVWLAADREAEINPSEELLGRTVHDVLGEEPATTVQTAIDRVLDSGEIQDIEYAVQGPENRYWYEARAAPLPSDTEGGSEVVLVARDISTRREYERQLERQNERLDQFASVASHDLRNPLNVVQGRVELVRSECDDESVLEHADAAATAADRMADLIDDLLTLARTDRQELALEPVGIEHAAERAWSAISEPGIELSVVADVTVQADLPDLIRLFENLFRNSVEHGYKSREEQRSSGNRKPEASGENQTTSDDAVEHSAASVSIAVEPLEDGFAVVDDGPGIEERDRDRIFESGYSTASEGTGYGLEIVERIADAHGWTIQLADSESGARFEITGVDIEDGSGTEPA